MTARDNEAPGSADTLGLEPSPTGYGLITQNPARLRRVFNPETDKIKDPKIEIE